MFSIPLHKHIQFYILLTAILNVPKASAEIPITQVPQYVVYGICGQDCVKAISSQFSSDLGYPLLNPASCLCSSDTLSLLQTAALQCGYASCTARVTSDITNALVNPSVGMTIFASYCTVNGFTYPTVALSETTTGMSSYLMNNRFYLT